MDIGSDCSTPTLYSNEKEKNVIKEPQNKDTKFTPPLEEAVSPNCTALAADVEGVGVSKNVRRRLLASHSSMTMNANMISETSELHVGPAYIIENCGRSDDPVNASRLLTPSEKRVAFRPLSKTTIIKNHDITHGTIIPISKNFDGFRNIGNAAFRPLESKVPNPVTNYTMQCPMPIVMIWMQYDCNNTQRCNTSSLDGRKYSPLALEDLSLDHMETKLYD
ncbi:hypothetical protein Tco_1082002 [Tanacetum coccineum]|uniref:Uncharacterized protein n=1 Tax=Tanacetum coccineum TaxID=301880 RepID=A0ABQ5I194_9ASTR